MRILFITAHKHLPELRGGMEVNTHDLALRLIQRGVQVGVLCGLAGKGSVGFRARLHIKLLNKQCPMDRSLGYPVWRAWESEQHVHAVAEVFKPDAIVIQGGSKFDVLLADALRLQLPVFCYLHTQDLLPIEDDVLNNPLLNFISNSEFTCSLHPNKRFCGVVRPLILPELYATMGSRNTALFVNPAPHKGLGIVLALAAARPDVPFVFAVNKSEVRASVAAEIHQLKLRNVELSGPVSDMRPLYRQAKIVLAPSQWQETWGRIATEAHFSDIPVLASSSGGLPEAVGPGGVCLPADAPESEWIRVFNRIWDEQDYYASLSDAAHRHSRRPEIAPDNIVESFIAMISRSPQTIVDRVHMS
ncbi:glycosyltransferase [Massilia varians]